MVFETLIVRNAGTVLFVEISAPPMNLIGPELIRDLVSLIQQAETNEALQVLVFKSANPDYFISHVDVTRIKENREPATKLTGEPSLGLLVRYLSASRLVTIAQIEGRVRGVGSEFILACDIALCREGVSSFWSVRTSVRCYPRRRRRPIPHAADGPWSRARSDVECARLRRGFGRSVRLDQSSVAS